MALRARTAIRCGQPAPPRHPLVARGAREPQQQIAMTGERRAESNEVAGAQLVERPQKVMLVAQPAIVFRDGGGAVTLRRRRCSGLGETERHNSGLHMAGRASGLGLTGGKCERCINATDGFRFETRAPARIDSEGRQPKHRGRINKEAHLRVASKYGRSRTRSGIAAFGLRLSLLAVLISLIAQTVAFGAHAARAADDARAASAALSKIVGAPVWVCAQDDGAPQAPAGCHESCPLCSLAQQTLALDAPEAPSTPAAPLALDRAQPPPQTDSRPATEPTGFALARGPPRSL